MSKSQRAHNAVGNRHKKSLARKLEKVKDIKMIEKKILSMCVYTHYI